jgi:cytochrome c oxidase accessory protein FixG
MFDRDTLVISYDAARGEPRGSRRRGVDAASVGKGDCVDCTLCVQVCPTGIDIRKGLQYECIGCAACIDACDGVMDKMGSPRGLIRYATQNGMAGHWTRRQMWRRVARPRVLVYSAVLVAVATAFVTSLALRAPFKADVVRDRGALARLVEDGAVENVYRVQLMNATERPQRFHLDVDGIDGARIAAWSDVVLAPTEARWVPFAVQLPAEAARSLGPGAHPIRVRIALRGDAAAGDTGEAGAQRREPSTFVIPR